MLNEPTPTYHGHELDEDPRLLAATHAYMDELELGNTPDRKKYFAQYPDIASQLAEYFDGIDLAHSLKPRKPLTSGPQSEPLGDFRLMREIGRGGMGIVYEAMQMSLGRLVAIKVLPFSASLDDRRLRRFKTEAQAAAQLHHTHIVPVYAVGVERGVHYYAMQLIHGQSVAEAIADEAQLRTPVVSNSATTHASQNVTVGASFSSSRSQKLKSIVKHIASVAEALDYAHELNIVHRDIKPSNLMIENGNKIWITDFGLAQIASDHNLTQTGDMIGTLRYMSPEQAMGGRTIVDHRTDIYSLGATLYEWLVGQPMFDGENRATLLDQILHHDPKPLRSIDRSIPSELETIVAKSVAKNANDRYDTALEFAEDLHRFLEQRPILAKRPTPVERMFKWLRRHPAFVASATLFSTLGFIGFAIATAMIANSQADTLEALQRETLRTQEAERRLELAKQAADEMIQLAELELANNPFQENLRTQLLSTASRLYEEFVTEHSNSAAGQTEFAQTLQRLQLRLNDLKKLELFRQCGQLQIADVRQDLQVDQEQSEQLDQWFAEMDAQREAKFRQMRNFRTAPAWEELVEFTTTQTEVASSILSSAQMKRLKQIAMQRMGPQAFHQDEVIQGLRLTSDQRGELQKLEQNTIALQTINHFMPPPNGQGPGFMPHPPKMDGPRNLDGREGPPRPMDRPPNEMMGGNDRDRGFRRGPPPGGPRGPEFGFFSNAEDRQKFFSQAQQILTPAQRELWIAIVGPDYLGE
ncbi:MAG: protein kinase [Planctomycetes bacterium]|nr:protein kinase [Planctomycetota bacterium]